MVRDDLRKKPSAEKIRKNLVWNEGELNECKMTPLKSTPPSD